MTKTGVPLPDRFDAGIGARLQQARTDQSKSIEEVAWRLRIRPEILRALEDEAFGDLGHHGFVRTSLRSYAREVGLDAGEILRAYRRRHEPSGSPSSLQALDLRRKRASKQGPRPRWVAAACVASVLLITGSVVGVLRGPSPKPQAQPVSFPAGPRVSEQASRAFQRAAAEQVVVRIASQRATQVRVIVDGKRTFEGVLAPGASQLFTGTRTIDVRVADVAAVTIFANEKRVTPVTSGIWEASFTRFGLRTP